jgi:hypothetical protein
MATRVHRPLKVIAFNANGIGRQRYELSKQLKDKVINPIFKWKYVNMNPTAPLIHGLVKLHKQDRPIRPIVKWKESPGYKLSKQINILLKVLTFPYSFNVHNSHSLSVPFKY